jgi:hypothetical protein
MDKLSGYWERIEEKRRKAGWRVQWKYVDDGKWLYSIVIKAGEPGFEVADFRGREPEYDGYFDTEKVKGWLDQRGFSPQQRPHYRPVYGLFQNYSDLPFGELLDDKTFQLPE